MNAPAKLLEWYDRRRRDLPWRQSRDPYRIWVSEIMLQQTQVATVIPYYERFLGRFPTLSDLAAAPIEEVLALWSGLGYYRRARQLHAAAQQVMAADGEIPSTAETLRQLPGIGPYTSAAIASIAFDECIAVLDGNVERVLCRYLALSGDPKKAVLRRQLSTAATGLLDPRRPGDGNQALMELGATVCKPQRAECPRCPLRKGCQALAAEQVELYPTPRVRRPTEKVELVAVVVEQDGRVLMFRRPDDHQLLAGMWELAMVDKALQGRMEAALQASYGGRWQLARRARSRIRHAITHRAIEVWIYGGQMRASNTIGEGPEAAWVDPTDRADYPVSSMVDKILKSWFERPRQRSLELD